MLLKLTREDFSWSRSQKCLPVFLLLWTGGFVLALSYLFISKNYLQEIERKEVAKLLDSYLSGYHLSNRFFDTFQLHLDTHLQGLYFVRIIHGGEQLLVVNEKVDQAGFKALADLDSKTNGVWIPLIAEKEFELFTIVVREYSNGVRIQAGKSGRAGYGAYEELKKTTIIFLTTSVLLLWPLSLLFIKQSLFPLISTRKKITQLADGSTSGFLPEDGNGPELDGLYCQINTLIRQNRQLVEEMQQSLDNVAHDLRTPMTRLRSVAEYGLQAEDDSSRLRDSLSDCLEESERVLAMLKIMMSVAEAESGTMRLELQECNLRESLGQIVSLYEYVAEEQGVNVELLNDDDVWIRADVTRISQVWANLLDNAIKYSTANGWVRMSYGKDHDGSVVITFEDNGMGISANEQSRIWERLYRGDRSRSQKGLGLGLNYVQAVVVAHGGTVAVSSNLHQGSQFVVRLPGSYVSTQEKSQTSGE